MATLEDIHIARQAGIICGEKDIMSRYYPICMAKISLTVNLH
jgi:hypothetical protein